MAVEQKPLMPKATAVWLVDNTALSFDQIADFCGLHPLEVKGIADEDVAPRYTPVSKRQDKPDAVYWLIRNHAEFSDSDIIKLVGTTKATIAKIRERSHWNAANIKAVDPVTLGLCSQLELDLAVSRVNAKLERAQKRAARKGPVLKTIAETTGPDAPVELPAREEAPSEGAPAPDEYALSSELEQD